MEVNVPAPPKDNTYRRDAHLFQIAITALIQLADDALGQEQEDLALATRLQVIEANVRQITANDPLLK